MDIKNLLKSFNKTSNRGLKGVCNTPLRVIRLYRLKLSRYTLLVATLFILLLNCQPCNNTQPYLILYAFNAEGQVLKEQMTVEQSLNILGRDVCIGSLSGKDIILAESGIGMTNASITTQRLIDEFEPVGVIFTGIAGAIDSAVQIGDIVICESWITHDYVYHGADGPVPDAITVYSPYLDSVIEMTRFTVDSTMFAVAAGISADSIAFRNIGDRKPAVLVGEAGVSGNAFIDNYEKRIWLKTSFHALITDMESAAVAQVCTVNDVPFIVFRSASDLAGGSGSESAKDELQGFFKVAADNSSTLVIKFLEQL